MFLPDPAVCNITSGSAQISVVDRMRDYFYKHATPPEFLSLPRLNRGLPSPLFILSNAANNCHGLQFYESNNDNYDDNDNPKTL